MAAPIGEARLARQDELVALVEEAAAVARAEGALLVADEVVDALERLPATMTSSIQRDAVAGRLTEVEAIEGAVVRAAERPGLSAPITARLVGELRHDAEAMARALNAARRPRLGHQPGEAGRSPAGGRAHGGDIPPVLGGRQRARAWHTPRRARGFRRSRDRLA